MWFLLLIGLVFTLPDFIDAAVTCPVASCKYVRPGDDGNGTDLTYGAANGTTYATAFDGFVSMTGLVWGDTVCLPGTSEPFFESMNTAVAGVRFIGCDTTPFLIWSAQGLSGNRSFNSSLAAVTSATYAWASMGSDIYKKRIDVIARILWEDSTYLTPIVHFTDSEAVILAALQPSTWTIKDEGSGVYTIYYRATATGNSPTNTVIRTHYVPASSGTPADFVTIDVNNITLQDGIIRGNTRSAIAPCPLRINDVNNTTIRRVVFSRNETGYCLSSVASAINDTLLDSVSVVDSGGTGAYISPGLALNRLKIIGGEYSRSAGAGFGGSAFSTGDGDGIGIGQLGGTATDISIEGITCSNNANSCIYVGTTSTMTVTNLIIQGAYMSGNAHGCINEQVSSQITGLFVIAGYICKDTLGGDTYADINLSSAPPVRTIILANGTHTGSRSFARIDYKPDVDNNLKAYNLLFYSNPGSSGSRDGGDWYFHESALIGDEIFINNWFYSAPNQHKKFAQIGSTGHRYYDSAANFTSWETTAGESLSTINTDPLLTGDFKLTANSPLRLAGTSYVYCRDARNRLCPIIPDIGGYQMGPDDPVSSRSSSTRGIAPARSQR